MPEFVRTFTSGKMNKDLDERLIPNGEYRDALNIEVSTSEGSDVGALQNIRGNVEVKNNNYNESTGITTEWTSDYISNLTNAVCIGSIADETNEKIYWFISSDEASAIAEFDQITEVTIPILVDTNGILNFSTDYLITGINIVEGMLFWTDDQKEPKQLTIEDWINSTSDFVTHSQIYGRDFIESDITVIKAGPKNAPSISLSKSLRNGITDAVCIFNFAEDQSGATGALTESYPVGEELTFGLTNQTVYQVNDIIVFTNESKISENGYTTVDNEGNIVVYSFNIIITDVNDNGASITGVIQNGTGQVINDDCSYNIVLKGEKPLFELKFPRFAYRYKFKNNQFSTFSPFSEVAFLPSTYNYKSVKGYNNGMVNNVKKITIGGLKDDLPADVEEIDVLYKETSSTAVYKVKTLKPDDLETEFARHYLALSADEPNPVDFEFTNTDGIVETNTLYPGGNITIVCELFSIYPESASQAQTDGLITDAANLTYLSQQIGYITEVTSELIYSVIPQNQILRPWDNVPRLAKAQEVAGNRLIYGNYLQNFTFDTDVKFNTSGTYISSRPITEIGEPEQSIKSIRPYQLGVVFRDVYGRETPVFTDNTGALNITNESSPLVSEVWAQMSTPAPLNENGENIFDSFKFFIKDQSAEYYNLAADKIYISEDGESVWISVASSETNKVAEGDVIILKKWHSSDEAEVNYPDNKFKILSKVNEAPEELLKKKSVVFSNNIGFDISFGENQTIDYKLPGSTPVEGYNTILISRFDYANIGDGDNGTALKNGLVKGNFVRFSNGAGVSSYYEVETKQVDTDGADEIRVVFKKSFGPDVNFLYENPNDANSPLVQKWNTIEISEEIDGPSKGSFQGRFFIRLEKTQLLLNAFSQGSNYKTLDAFAIQDRPLDPTGSYGWYGGGGGLLQDSLGNEIGTGARLGTSVDHTLGGFGGVPGGMPTAALDYSLIQYEPNEPWDLAIYAFTELESLEFGNKIVSGRRVKFSTHNAVYEIKDARKFIESGRHIWFVRLDRRLEAAVSPDVIQEASGATFVQSPILLNSVNNSIIAAGGTPNWVNGSIWFNGDPVYVDGVEIYPGYNFASTTMAILEPDLEGETITQSPAIFETEPKDKVDLEIYFEASNALPIAEYNDQHLLPWFNCYSFGNGVESNRIRDDFNAPYIDTGTKASAVLDENYEEERLSTGLIFSGIFNSTSSVNNLNQFIQAENITKLLNPSYGSIQKLHSRNTDLITLCENKALKVLANKDALYNADGSVNVTSNNNVLGQAVPFAGEYGISKNPESFAQHGFRVYFSDKARGAVIRLSIDGLETISRYGMDDFFMDNLKASSNIIGSYDSDKDCYNITLDALSEEWQDDLQESNTTVSFKESVRGWESRKSFIPENGISLNSIYYTFKDGLLWKHNANPLNNNFYNTQHESSLRLVFSEDFNLVKNYKTLNYNGTASKKYIYNVTDGVHDGINYSIDQITENNLIPTSYTTSNGWYAINVNTNLQEGEVKEFKNKEGKYFNYIKGIETYFNSDADNNVDTNEFSVQGIGNPSSVTGDTTRTEYTLTIENQ